MVNKKKTSQYDDYITNRILGIFGLSFVLILGLMVTYRGYSSLDSFQLTTSIVYGFSAAAAAATIAGVIWAHISGKKVADPKVKPHGGKTMAEISAMTAIVAFIAARYYVDGVRLLYVFIPVAAVLALIKLIYSNDFFLIAAITSVGGSLMWDMSRSHYGAGIFEMTPSDVAGSRIFYLSVAFVVILAVAIPVLAAISKKSGEVQIGARHIMAFTASANYPLMYLSVAVAILCTVIGFIFGAAAAYYLIFVAFGYLFITAFYYTVKLM